MTPLEEILIRQITRLGPISIADYMAQCLLHPHHGYYTTRDPLGAQGDFTTAPEISQMFGEMLALSLVQEWRAQGHPDFILAELGPGRGTLMSDILRVIAQFPDMAGTAEIWLVEASPTLRKVQADTITHPRLHWADRIEDLPEAALFLVANEFFDALPIRQFVAAGGQWHERMVRVDEDRLGYAHVAGLPAGLGTDGSPAPADGAMLEIAPAAPAIAAEIARRIAAHGGAALITDYGHWGEHGDTLQSLRDHEKVDPLAFPGESDLTAHVDFRTLAEAATGVARSGLIPQGVFLERLGITQRAQDLATKLEGAARDAHIAAHRRLTHPAEMGSLFKGLALYPLGRPAPPGFDAYDP